MTLDEKKMIDTLLKCVNDLREENKKFRDDVTVQVGLLNAKVVEKHVPLSLETTVVHAVNDTIREGLKKILTDSYDSPLRKYANNIIGKYQVDIEKVFDKIVSDEINTKEFEDSVKHALMHKIAKSVTSGIDGSVEKVVTQMKQDQVFRSKLTLFINTLVDEFLKR